MSHLIDEMAKDMKIYPYRGEKEKIYRCRLIYSAIAEWMRVSTKDYPDKNVIGKSKSYVLARMKQILSAYIDSFPEIKDWFLSETDSLGDVVRDIREKMLRSGELIEVSEKEKIISASNIIETCGDGVARVYGIIEENISVEYVGITKIISNSKYEHINSEKKIDTFIEWIYSNAMWNVQSDISDYELFDVFSKKPPYQSWTKKINKSIKYHIGRVSLYNDMHEYWLLKYDNGIWYSAPVSDFLREYKEERRIILALRRANNNSMEASYKHYGSVVQLNLYCKLPIVDESYIETFCWPLRNVMDKLDYVVPFKMWDQISNKLENELGILLVEKL